MVYRKLPLQTCCDLECWISWGLLGVQLNDYCFWILVNVDLDMWLSITLACITFEAVSDLFNLYLRFLFLLVDKMCGRLWFSHHSLLLHTRRKRSQCFTSARCQRYDACLVLGLQYTLVPWLSPQWNSRERRREPGNILQSTSFRPRLCGWIFSTISNALIISVYFTYTNFVSAWSHSFPLPFSLVNSSFGDW